MEERKNEENKAFLLSDTHPKKINENQNIETLPEKCENIKQDTNEDHNFASNFSEHGLEKLQDNEISKNIPAKQKKVKNAKYLLNENRDRDFGRSKRGHIKNKKNTKEIGSTRNKAGRIRKRDFEQNELNNYNIKTISKKSRRKEAEKKN